jgi:predicted nucleic acid-binding protein
MLSGSAIGQAALEVLERDRSTVPAHFDAEVYSVFRRRFRQGLLPRARLDLIVIRLGGLVAERVGLRSLLAEAHVLADRVSAADAFYLALARARDAELVTCDERLARGAAGLARIRLVTAP